MPPDSFFKVVVVVVVVVVVLFSVPLGFPQPISAREQRDVLS